MDAKKTIEKLRGETDRARVSLYLSQSILNEFKEACSGISPSKVMEELMKDFIASDKKNKPAKVKKPSKKS
jgi:hypothetical protein